MRWLPIQKANIDAELREYFEQRGAETTRAFVPVSWSIKRTDGVILTERQLLACLIHDS
jgi:hypothetical protein